MSRQHEDSRPLSQYDVFISYSRGDGRLAASIQRGLQRIAHPWYKRAIIRVVRDVTTMSTGPDLRQAVLDYLDDSRNLIVIGRGLLAVLTELRDGQSQLLVYDDTSGRPALQLVPWSGIPMRLMTGRHLAAVSEETVEVEPVWRDSRQLVRMLCASVARTPTVAERERFLSGQRVEGCVVSIRGGGLIKGCPVTWARVGWSAGRWCRRGP